MNKQKTKKSVLKRFKITKSGKVLRGHIGGRHRKAHKTKKRIRHFAEPIVLSTKKARGIKRLLGL